MTDLLLAFTAGLAIAGSTGNPGFTAGLHCETMADSLARPEVLRAALSETLDLDALPPSMSKAEREKALNYLWGRPDIIDMSFLAGEYWPVARREERIHFNAAIGLALAAKLGKIEKKEGDCLPQAHIWENRALVFTALSGHSLAYSLEKPREMKWIITDISIDGESLWKLYGEILKNELPKTGLGGVTKRICGKNC